ncbi:MAG TPA: hypothetical protein PKA43_00150 [Candidatus Competibacter phosphatis]|nr:hypothetical protein [Candidatus Competibacter phosphatis]
MKIIRMVRTMAGPHGVFPAGQVRTVADEVADPLIAAKAAVLIRALAPPGPPQPPADGGRGQETAAVAPAPEAAVPSAPRKKVKKVNVDSDQNDA